MSNYYVSLILTLVIGILIILVFNFYVATAKDLDFWRRFIEMAAISLGAVSYTHLDVYKRQGILSSPETTAQDDVARHEGKGESDACHEP